jgi:uncharacterized protein (DUF3084 family)
MGTLLVVIFLLAVSGLIAYVGDLLGRRMGKRRLSMFGLRPRHTAILFTIVTGVLIACVSLVAAFSVSPGVRLALTQGEALVRKNQRLRENIHAQKESLTSLSAALEARQGEIEGLQKREGRLRGQNERLGQQTRRLGEEHARLQGSMRYLAGTNHRLQGRNAGLTRANAALAGHQRQLHTAVGNLRMSNGRLASARKRAEQQLDETRGTIRILASRAEALRRTAERFQQDDLTFSQSEEIARVAINVGAPPTAIRQALDGLVREVRREAAARGARGLEPHRDYAYMVPVRPADARPAGEHHEEAELQDLATRLASLSRRWAFVIRAVANENCIVGMPVPFMLLAFQNQLVLRKGEEVAAARIDGRQSEATILEQLVGFLQTQVRAKALRKLGMVPNSHGELGEVGYEPLLEVVRKIRDTQGWAKVGAVARGDTLSASPLLLEFYVVPDEQAADAG